jgi:hypothetical protein
MSALEPLKRWEADPNRSTKRGVSQAFHVEWKISHVIQAIPPAVHVEDLTGDICRIRAGEEAHRSRHVQGSAAGSSTVSLQTKKIEGLHENDFIMATKIDRIFARMATA